MFQPTENEAACPSLYTADERSWKQQTEQFVMPTEKNWTEMRNKEKLSP
jgi:hypothetical protein